MWLLESNSQALSLKYSSYLSKKLTLFYITLINCFLFSTFALFRLRCSSQNYVKLKKKRILISRTKIRTGISYTAGENVFQFWDSSNFVVNFLKLDAQQSHRVYSRWNKSKLLFSNSPVSENTVFWISFWWSVEGFRECWTEKWIFWIFFLWLPFRWIFENVKLGIVTVSLLCESCRETNETNVFGSFLHMSKILTMFWLRIGDVLVIKFICYMYRMIHANSDYLQVCSNQQQTQRSLV